jgi:hypothetical protein
MSKGQLLERIMIEPGKCESGSHTIYWNPQTGRREPVPRHSEIPEP